MKDIHSKFQSATKVGGPKSKQIQSNKFKIFKKCLKFDASKISYYLGFKNLILGFVILTECLFFQSLSAFPTEDLNNSILVRALKDELNRSIIELHLPNQSKPYYIAYRVIDEKRIEIRASSGGLLYSGESGTRDLYVDLRVGNYQLDNSNFVCQTSGSRIIESDKTLLPLEDEYFSLRQAAWLVTDGTYKKALEQLARKNAYLQNKQTRDTIPDFVQAKPCSIIEPNATFSVDRKELDKKIVDISNILKDYPRIMESFVSFKLVAGNQYFLNSEGAQNIRQNGLVSIEVKAKAQTKDGELIGDFIGFYGKKLDDIDFVRIKNLINAWAETLSMKTEIDNEEDGYSGPVLFLGQAACELFFQILGKGVSDARTPLYESEMMERYISRPNTGILSDRLGRRVVPNFISAFDDPELKQWNNVPVIGGYSIDEQGVRAEKVELIKDGKLTGLLMSRAPVSKIKRSNGHGRYFENAYSPRYIGFVSNLLIRSEQNISYEELLSKLKELAVDYGNDYAIVITRLEPTKPMSEIERYQRLYRTGAKTISLLSSPMNVYKLYLKNDSLKLIRGLDFSQITPRILRDIISAGNSDHIYNFIYRDNNGNEYPVSVVAPAVLVEEIDLLPKKGEMTKPPVVSRP